jgi:transcriptional regulator with XRE-family HTH domain
MKDHGGFYKRVGESIRVRRKEQGLSQEALAWAVGLKRPSMSNIEKGRQNLLLHTFCEIAETLNTDSVSLLPERVIPEPTKAPDLRSYSKGEREFIEAGIKTAKRKKG